MFAQERRQAIIELLHREGRVEVAALANHLGVAEETIRRDLRWLEDSGQAIRTHGGALLRAGVVSAPGGVPGVPVAGVMSIGPAFPGSSGAKSHSVALETAGVYSAPQGDVGVGAGSGSGAFPRALPAAIPTLSDRQNVGLEAKRSIGRVAANMIEAGESVLIDSGSTALEIARALRSRLANSEFSSQADVHVVTNSLTVAAELAGAPHVAVTVLGGTLHAAELCLVGPDTLEALSRYRLDRVFVACAGIDQERGIAAANPFEAEVKRAMLNGASLRIVVADASKLGHTALVQVAGLSSVDMLITNQSAEPKVVAEIQAAGVRVELA